MRTIAGVCLPAYSAMASCGMITYGVRPLPAISGYVDVISATQPWGVDLLVSEPGQSQGDGCNCPLARRPAKATSSKTLAFCSASRHPTPSMQLQIAQLLRCRQAR